MSVRFAAAKAEGFAHSDKRSDERPFAVKVQLLSLVSAWIFIQVGGTKLTSMGHLKPRLRVRRLHSKLKLENASQRYAPIATCEILLKISAAQKEMNDCHMETQSKTRRARRARWRA